MHAKLLMREVLHEYEVAVAFLKPRTRLGPSRQEARDVAPGGVKQGTHEKYTSRIAQKRLNGRSEATR